MNEQFVIKTKNGYVKYTDRGKVKTVETPDDANKFNDYIGRITVKELIQKNYVDVLLEPYPMK